MIIDMSETYVINQYYNF